MASNIHIAAATRNLMLNAGLDQLNTGTINVYSGTQPATGDTALSGNTLLVQMTFGATAYAAASAGSKTANAITSGTAVATGTAAWFRLFKSDGTTAVIDGSAGLSGCDINLDAVAIQSGATVSITSSVLSLPA